MPAWVRVTALNLLRNRWRSLGRERRAVREVKEQTQFGDVEDTHELVDLRAAIAGLSRGQREAVALHYRLGRSVIETAQAVQVAEGTVKTLLSRARSTLAQCSNPRKRTVPDEPFPTRKASASIAGVVLAAGLALAGCSSSPAASPSTSTSSVANVSPPGSWTHVFGSAAISVPAKWSVLLDANCPNSSEHGTLYLGGPREPGIFCPAALATSPQITITRLSASTVPGGTSTQTGCKWITVNRLRVAVGPCAGADIVSGGLTTWTIPGLGIQVSAASADGLYTGARTDTEVGKILHTIRRATPSEIATRSALQIQIALSRTSVTAGQAIKGTVSFVNTTTEHITVETCAANSWLDAGLTGHGVAFAPVHTQIACAPTVNFAPGTTAFPIVLSTTYSQCGETGKSVPAAAIPTCLATGPPPLPTGKYRTAVVAVGLPTDTTGPNVLYVTVRH